MSHIVIISGSPTPGSRLNGLIEFVEGKWNEKGIKISHIRVADLPAEALLHANFKDEQILAALALVESASGVVIASPVYKASFTGILKAFLDLLPQTGLKGKVTLPLFIGGTIAHLLSLDYALKPVLSVLGSRNILAGVFAIDQWVQRLENGGFELSDELAERLDRSADELAEEIEWLDLRAKESGVNS
ncbi:NADPH-dependent FMN reductase [Cohnella terricola]|uniref:NADPH-dependent FMN reductase n=1 Tax=Cohnella terricola TaxID=1289167 RepID=A0A559J997_9BACL|nr:NADPH-dependent FMN reductase [Cohnella terricola]TVX96450.1 NADPH-dependent FMN reductase [Cohnella terricola]